MAETMLHTDELLRKHHLLLRVDRTGNAVLVDALSERIASKTRVKRYLMELKQNPGFPGSKVAAWLMPEGMVQ